MKKKKGLYLVSSHAVDRTVQHRQGSNCSRLCSHTYTHKHTHGSGQHLCRLVAHHLLCSVQRRLPLGKTAACHLSTAVFSLNIYKGTSTQLDHWSHTRTNDCVCLNTAEKPALLEQNTDLNQRNQQTSALHAEPLLVFNCVCSVKD